MGVLGLWRLVDATGKPVPLETLEGKVLAIDISIWIHQVIQGYQDRRGNALPNAHLIGLFNRLCKLMYFKIKPIFVFDGGVPLLKKNTIAARRKLKSVAVSKAQKLKNDLINNLIKHAAVKGVLDKENHEGESSASQKDSVEIPGSSKEVDLYKLPKILSPRKLTNSEDYIDSDDEDFNETSPRKQTKWTGNIHSVDVNTPEFQSLPADVRYDILTDLKETRKQNSWGRLHELPTGSNNYAGFQIGRLLKRRYVQESLEKAEKEMGGRTLTLEELDRLLTDQGINTKTEDDAAFRIASDSTTRVLFASDKLSQNSVKSKEESEDGNNQNENKEKQVNDALSDSVSVHSENSLAIIDDLNAYDFEDWFSEGDFDENSLNESSLNDSHSLPASAIPKSDLNPALAYMLEHSGLTRDAVLKIVDTTRKNKQKSESNGSTSSKGAKKNSKRSSLMNKKKNLFRAFMASPKMKKKIPKSGLVTIVESNSETENGGMNSETIVVDVHKEESAGSNSESEDFEEVSKKSEVEAHKENDVESISDSDDFVEVSENTSIKNTVEKDVESQKESVMELSDSGSDDFVEVQDVPISKALPLKKDAGNGFQITIKADEELEDDIFADIFVDDNKGKKENTIVENKPVLDELVKKEITISPEKNNFSEAETKSPEKFLPELKSEPEPFTTPEKINLSPAKIEPISESKNLPEKMTPEEILKHIKSTLSLIKTTDDEKGIENIILNDKVIDLEDPAQLDQITNFIQENDSVAKNLFEEKDFLTQENKQSSEDIIEPDVIDELFKDKGLDKGFEEVTIIENNPPPLVLPQDEKELESMKQQLESEQKAISGTIGKLERQAVDITDQMRLEAQELLRLFGYPYIVAPMEAEAQCAYLEQIKLTNGTVTDDSDIWLFGGHCVYKNFFDNNKKVLQFLSDDIEHHFNLSRKEMIQLALLVGSDYTNGLCGVGPVTALEILASFPSDGEDILRGLRSFCAWYKAGRLSAPNKATLRNKLKHIAIERGFPSQAVVQAYLCPMVDESTEAFSWGKPNFTLLTDYVKQKFGWTKLKFDEIMNPILKKLSQTKTQRVMESYFKIQTIPKSIESAMSKRVHNAVQKLSGKIHDDEDTVNGKSKIEKIKKARKAAVGKRKKPTDDSEDVAASSDQNENTGEPQPKKPRKPRARKANKVVGDSEDTAVSGDPNENDGEPQPKKPRKPRARKAAGNSENAAENVGANEIDGEPQPKKPRKPRVKKAQKVENPIEEVNINKNEDNLETNEEASENLEKIPENQDFTTEFQNDDIKLKQRRICIGHETDEVIPQRERDKVNALNTKLKAIEIYRKSKMNQPATKKKRVVKKLKKDAELSEDSDSN